MMAISLAFKKGVNVPFKKGEILMSPKKTPRGVYLITEGFVVSYSQSSSGKRRIQTILKKNDIFPLVWAISDVLKNVYIETLSDGNALLLDKEIFLDYINNTHEATVELITILLNMLSTYVDRVDNLENDTVREKVITRILFYSNRFGVSEDGKIAIDLPITHKLIAESISVSRENVTRELKILEKKKLISFKKRQLIISDIKRLSEELQNKRD
jgi:CRP-like cAMP-binding protein